MANCRTVSIRWLSGLCQYLLTVRIAAWYPNDPFSALYELDMQPSRLRSQGILGYLEIDWRRQCVDFTSVWPPGAAR